MTETLNEISRKACMMQLTGKRAFSDVFTDWLVAKGIEVTSEMIDKISNLYGDWYNRKGIFYTKSGRYRNIGRYELGAIILNELDIKVN
ncbi:MAG: hypothetical protein IMZ64_08645 [Bacteroidetes bacterium]|nr:hypothetical protein [Bacteroidota bacterium]